MVASCEPHWLEIWYWCSQVILCLIAFGTAIFAGIQLRVIRRSRLETLKTAKATFLLELDRRWDSAEMIQTRERFVRLRDDVKKKVSSENAVENPEERRRVMQEEFHKSLSPMKEINYKEYLSILRMCGFFETVSLMVKREYVDRRDIIDLFRGPMEQIDMCFPKHIKECQKEVDVTPGLYEHALSLCKVAASGAVK
jgi:hypothetical protein